MKHIDLTTIDWSKNNSQLARELGCSETYIRLRRPLSVPKFGKGRPKKPELKALPMAQSDQIAKSVWDRIDKHAPKPVHVIKAGRVEAEPEQSQSSEIRVKCNFHFAPNVFANQLQEVLDLFATPESYPKDDATKFNLMASCEIRARHLLKSIQA
jgi:hypothetical protein